MNLVIIATAGNFDGVAAFVNEAVVRQHSPVNGCLCIIHEKSIDPDRINALANKLAGVFATQVSYPTSLNPNLGEQARIALLFSMFYLQAYTRYPGPWLVVDDWALPRENDFMQLLDLQHAAYGGKLSGRATITNGAVVPVGPVVVGAPARELQLLSYSTNESWRTRGQYNFANVGWGQVPPEDYLFILSDKKTTVVPKSPLIAPASPPVAPPVKAPPPSTDIHVVNASPRVPPPGFQADEEYLRQGMEKVAPVNAAITHPPKEAFAAAPPEHSHLYTMNDFEDKKALLAEVQRVTGDKPHHFTGNAKLLEMLNNTPAQ